MPNDPLASTLRQQIARLTAELAGVQHQLLGRRRMIPASLIERHLGTTSRKRSSCAFYLSVAERGRTRLVYVPKDRCERVRAQVEGWKEYRAHLRRWRELTEMIWQRLQQLGRAQTLDPQERAP